MNNFAKRVVSKLRRELDKIYPDYIGDNFQCSVCQTNLAHFLPLPTYFFKELNEYQHVHSIFQAEMLNLESYLCPACQASDRDRLYALYFQRVMRGTDSKKLLDFAPSPAFQKFLKSNFQLDYRSADLFMPNVDDVVDITDMKQYDGESFDIFICSHVLEHVSDDRKAMRELYRVLRRGGWGIAVVPINLGLKEIHEDASITSEADRWKYFGQGDHLRMYSKQSFVERLEEAGFTVQQLGIDYFGAETFTKFGIQSRSVLYVAHKK